MRNYVRIVEKPFTADRLYETHDQPERAILREALRCRRCERPSCTGSDPADIRGVMRRAAVGNFTGAKKCWLKAPADPDALARFESRCILRQEEGRAAAIRKVVEYVCGGRDL